MRGLIDAAEAARQSLRQRPGDQPLPTPNDNPICHEMAIDGLLRRYGPTYAAVGVRDMLRSRLELGISRYGTPLQPLNGRDFLRDLQEELLDALAYSWGVVYEMRHEGRHHEANVLELVHIRNLENTALNVQRLMDERKQDAAHT